MSQAASIVGGLLLGGGTAYAAERAAQESAKQRTQAESLAKQQFAEQERLVHLQMAKQDEYYKKQEQAQVDAEKAQAGVLTRNAQLEEQKRRMRAANGRRSTILSGPLGIVDEQQKGKTVLGA